MADQQGSATPEKNVVMYADLKLMPKDTVPGTILGWFHSYEDAENYMNKTQAKIERIYICQQINKNTKGMEKKFIIYTDIKLTPGYDIPGIQLKRFSTRAEAEDYLRRSNPEINQIYIHELEPLYLKTFTELRRQ